MGGGGDRPRRPLPYGSATGVMEPRERLNAMLSARWLTLITTAHRWNHRRNRSMGPTRAGRASLQLSGDHGNPVYLVPSDFCNWLSFSLCTVGGLQCFPYVLAEFEGRRKEEYREGNGWSNKWRRKRNRGRKGRGSASTPRRVPSNFSAVFACLEIPVMRAMWPNNSAMR